MAGRLDQPEGPSLQGTGLGTGLSKFLAGFPDIRVLHCEPTRAAIKNFVHSRLPLVGFSTVFEKSATASVRVLGRAWSVIVPQFFSVCLGGGRVPVLMAHHLSGLRGQVRLGKCVLTVVVVHEGDDIGQFFAGKIYLLAGVG